MAAGPSFDSATSLATACPSCSTVFRVVQDQLKVSQGWVRCGRCHEVFNALEALFDLDKRRDVEPAARRGNPGLPSAAPPGSTYPAAPAPGGWDDTSTAALPDNRRSAVSAAAALRDRLAARSGGNVSPPSPPAARTGMLVEEPHVNEAELDTRFEPKFFDADSAPGSRRPPVSGGRASEEPRTTSSGAASAPPVAAVSAAPAPLAPVAAAHEVPKAWTLSAGAGNDTDPRREPWLMSPVAASAGLTSDDRAGDHWNETIVDPAMMSVDVPAGAALTSRAASPMQAAAAPVGGDIYQPAPIVETHSGVAAAGPMTQPGFLRDAERNARWQRPWVRLLLSLVCLLLLATAALQLGIRNRDRYAARWPVTRPVLAQVCTWLGCSLQPPRLLEALVVETSSLTRPPGIDGLRLQIVLRNRVDHEVAAPHVELTLTDAAGAVAARRVFNPGEFGVTRAVLGSQQDGNWSLVFNTPLRNIAGYTVSVFYP
jgi:predicted Zn finger-like uncharacterized protein